MESAKTKKFGKRGGFTLIEVMLAATIMVIIIGAVLISVSRVMASWDRSAGAVQGYYEGDALADFMSQDLEAMLVKRDGRAWMQVTYPYDVGELKGASVGGIPVRPPQIMFFSPSYVRPRFDNSQMMNKASERQPIPGSICAVKYQMSYKNPFMQGSANEGSNAQQPHAFYGLYRAVLDSKSTFEDALGEPQGDERTNEFALAEFWAGVATVLNENGAYVRGTDLKSWVLSPENYLSGNIVDFQVTFAVMYKQERALRPGESPYSIAYIPPGVPFTVADKIYVDGQLYARGDGGGLISVSPTEVEHGFLSHAEISVTFMSDAGASELKNLKGAEDSLEKFQELRQLHGTTTSRKIHFRVQPTD